MKKQIFKYIVAVASIVLSTGVFTSCLGQLDRFPTNDLTSEKVYTSLDGYKSVMAKVYGAYCAVGNDVTGKDDMMMGDGFSADFLRCLFSAECLTTEEAICAWPDNGIPDLNFMTWSANNTFLSGLYYRAMYQITLVNEFLRESTPEKLQERGIPAADVKEIEYFRAEARFLRALQYWVLMNEFGNPPFVNENFPIGKELPPQKNRQEIFSYVESELLAIENLLKAPKTNDYARVDQAACWALLARMYLNAEVYIGEPRYTEAITFCNKIIEPRKYHLKAKYAELFLADNNVNNPEVILPLYYDGLKNKTYSGTTFIINSSFIVSREDVPEINFQEYYGMGGLGGWYGNRARKQLPERFDNADSRKLFFGSHPDVDNVSAFEEGTMVAKFRNVTSTGEYGSNFAEAYADTDYPLFRLAEIYFIYAESVLRGGAGGEMSKAIEYFNEIRYRAYGDDSHKVNNLDLDMILEERSKELYWECCRRTDLIRYGLFTSGKYLWQWKGGVKEGMGVGNYMNLFPLPATDIMANPNLKQNEGY